MPAFKKASRGQPFKPSASLHNATIDTILARQREKFDAVPTPGRQRGAPDACIIDVKNSTEADLERFSVLGVSAPIILPSESADEFKARPTVVGVEPDATHAETFVVLLEPVAAGGIVRGVAAGVTVALLDVVDEADTHAAAAAGSTSTLRTSTSGAAVILWKESGTGEKWGIVRIGAGAAGGVIEVKCVDDNGHTGLVVSVVPTADLDAEPFDVVVNHHTSNDDIFDAVPLAAPHDSGARFRQIGLPPLRSQFMVLQIMADPDQGPQAIDWDYLKGA